MDGMFGDASEDVGQVGLRVDAVHLCCLCRPVNYAERSRAQSFFQSRLRAVERTSFRRHSA